MDVDEGFSTEPSQPGRHNRNLGFDSVTGSGPGQELDVTGTSGTFTLTLGGQTTSAADHHHRHQPPRRPLLEKSPRLLTPSCRAAGEAGESVSSVTQDGNIYRVLFTGPDNDIPLMQVGATTGTTQVLINPIYGLQVANPLTILGNGLAGAPDGALDSHTGINTYTGTITNGVFVNVLTGLIYNEFVFPPTPVAIELEINSAAIGVDVDVLRFPRTLSDSTPLPSARRPTRWPITTHLQWDYSLTGQGLITGGDLVKTGLGDLILPNENNYGDTTGVGNPTTDIQLGWITIQNGDLHGLGAEFSALGVDKSPAELESPQTSRALH